MKKLFLLLLGSCIFLVGPSLQAATNRHKTAQPAAQAIRRSPQDPLTLTLLGKEYVLLKSEESEAVDNGWDNVYVLDGEEEAQSVIQIIKVPDTTCQAVADAANEDMESFLTYDQRDPNNILFSQMDDDVYMAGKVVQADKDVFVVYVAVGQTNKEDEQLQPDQRKQIFSAVRDTPISVLTENFVHSMCKFGEDCRAN